MLPRPFFCPVHLHIMREKLGCCAVIDEELVKEVVQGLDDDDPWREADVSEIMVRANGQEKLENVYLPTEDDSTVLVKGV